MATFTLIFLLLLAVKFALDLWLDYRQIHHVAAHRDAVPPRFAAAISLEAHQKAADYSVARLRLGRIEGGYGLLLLLVWTLCGGLDWLAGHFAVPTLSGGVLFILAFMLLGSLLDLPFSLIRTFVVEQRFGFNRTTLPLFLVDLAKGMLLTLAIGVPLIALLLWLMQAAGNLWWFYGWLVWSGFTLSMMWAFPTLIAPLFNKFEPLSDEALKERIEALLLRCGFASKGLFVMDGSKRSSHGNAYFSGLGSAKRIVFFDTLIQRLTPTQIEAVLAHELGHFRMGHVKKMLAMMIGMSLLAFAALGQLGSADWFYRGLGVAQQSNAMLLLLFVLVLPLFTFFLTPLSNLLSRKHEFEADDFAAQHADSGELIGALVRLYEDNAATLTPDPLYSAWHDSHPPAPIRIAHLEQLGGGGGAESSR